MTNLVVHRVNALPGTLDPSAFYIVKATNTALVELYFTSTDGATVRHVLNSAEVDAKIAAAIASMSGGTATTVFPTAPVRYEALSSPNYKVHCMSSSVFYTKLSWSRATTTMTIQHNAHGRSVGDRVIIKDTNVTVLNVLITSVTTNAYTVACADTGASSGTSGSYTCGFTYAHNSEVAGALTGGALTAPVNVDIMLHSLRVHTPANSRTTTTYDMVLPVTAWNSAIGPNLTKDEIYLPMQQLRADTDFLTAVANTIAMNQSAAGYATLRFGALGASAQGQLMLLQF